MKRKTNAELTAENRRLRAYGISRASLIRMLVKRDFETKRG